MCTSTSLTVLQAYEFLPTIASAFQKNSSPYKNPIMILVSILFLMDFWFVFWNYGMSSPLVDSYLGKEAVRNSWGTAENKDSFCNFSQQAGKQETEGVTATHRQDKVVESTIWSLSVCGWLGQDHWTIFVIVHPEKHGTQKFSFAVFNSFWLFLKCLYDF